MNEKIGRFSSGKKPVYFSDSIDLLIEMNVAMVAEISALRERLSTIGALAKRKGSFSKSEIEEFILTDEEVAARLSDRAALGARLYGGLEVAIATITRQNSN